MNENFDLYKTLNVARDATKEAIRKAYRKAAKSAHPDTPEGSPEKFRRVQTALIVLSDDKQRQHYDATGEVGEIEPDNELAEVLGYLSFGMDMALGKLKTAQRDGTNADLCKEMVIALQEHKVDVRKFAANFIDAIPLFEQTLGRFKKNKKDDGENWLERVAKEKIRQCRYQEAVYKKKLETIDRAIKFIADYGYDYTAPPPRIKGPMSVADIFNTALGPGMLGGRVPP